MGRYYDGDIEGKFWFGVQDSNDAEFFGAQDVTNYENEEEDYHGHYIDYCIANTDINNVLEGIRILKIALGKNGKILETFFEENNGYNDEMIIQHYKDRHNIELNENELRTLLEYLARLQIGIKILIFFNLNPNKDCNFTAEL